MEIEESWVDKPPANANRQTTLEALLVDDAPQKVCLYRRNTYKTVYFMLGR